MDLNGKVLFINILCDKIMCTMIVQGLPFQVKGRILRPEFAMSM